MSDRPQNGFQASAGTPPCLLPENRLSARLWLQEAMLTVETCFPNVNWQRDIDPTVASAFDEALAARFYGSGVISEEGFKSAWRQWYGVHL